jgi:hypothetical protein
VASLLAETWSSYPSFRRAINSLAGAADRLADIAPADLDDPAEVERKLGGDELAMTFTSALMLLRSDARQISSEQTLEMLRSLYEDEFGPSQGLDTTLARLAEIIHVDPVEARHVYTERIVRNALPTYMFSRGFVDGRVIPFDDGTIDVSAIGILRVTLDEPVGANDTVTFQLTEEGIVDLKLEIERIERMTSQLTQRVGGTAVEAGDDAVR